MKNKKIELKPLLIVSATQQDSSKDTRIFSCQSALSSQAKFKVVTKNKKGLSQVYNECITKKNEDKHDIVVFCHDDLYIDDSKIRGKLYKSMFVDGYDIVGLAGASTCKIDHDEASLWHHMSDRSSWTGTVFHPYGKDTTQIMSTTYGPTPQRCLLLDGVFLAINIKKIRLAKWKFNTDFMFHHYDLAGCIDANSKKLKLGTCMIHAVHDSPGLTSTDDPEWQISHKKFLAQYG
tara:strand:+ start:2161 stop:2862 length:702 start_codon:yes stop_codon:yes gene_type:complete